MVEWIDFETLALLFGMVITVLPERYGAEPTLTWFFSFATVPDNHRYIKDSDN